MSLTRVSLSMIGYSGSTTISTDTTITDDVLIGPGQIFTVASGKTLTFTGSFNAGVYQVFAGAGTVKFGNGATSEVYPEWWLATAGGDFGVAASKAFASIFDVGGKIVFTKSQVCTTPINFTSLSASMGIVIEGRGGSQSNYDAGITIKFKHTGVGIDCTGSRFLTFRDFKIGTDATTYPTVGILLARTGVAAGSSDRHTFYNVVCDYGCKFSKAALYNYASEEMTTYSCSWRNTASTANACAVVITCSNVFSAASSFVTISTGVQSNSVFLIYGGEATSISTFGSSHVYYLEGAGEFHVDGGLVLASGNASSSLFYVDNRSQAGLYNATICNVRDETGTDYFLNFAAVVPNNNPYNIRLTGNHFQGSAGQFLLYIGDGVKGTDFTLENNTSAGQVSVKDLELSRIYCNLFVGRAGGTILSCDITGNASSMSFLGSTTLTNIRDTQYNALRLVGNTGVSLPPVYIINTTGSSTTTVVTGMPYIKAGAFVFLTPASATAVALMASIYVSSIQVGVGFTLTHASTTSGLFNFMVINGT